MGALSIDRSRSAIESEITPLSSCSRSCSRSASAMWSPGRPPDTEDATLSNWWAGSIAKEQRPSYPDAADGQPPPGQGAGRGRAGPILDPEHAELTAARHRAFADSAAWSASTTRLRWGFHGSAGFGHLALATTAPEATVLPAFDDWNSAWRRFSETGRFDSPDQVKPGVPTSAGRTISGALAAHVTVAPGATVEVPFLLTWHYPNKYNEAGNWMGCHYATVWSDAATVSA